MEVNQRNPFDKNLLQRPSIESCLDQFGPFDAWMLCSLKLSLVLETGNMSLFHKSLSSWILGRDSFKGEGCNTPGVCHQLSNGFELKHGILSDDEDVKVKPMEMSPNLNLDIAPLLAYRPFFKIYAWVVWLGYLHVSHINTHLYWALEKFYEVWNKKSYEMISYILVGMIFTKCLNCTIKWMRTWNVNQTL